LRSQTDPAQYKSARKYKRIAISKENYFGFNAEKIAAE
jgi:hypothetical protein